MDDPAVLDISTTPDGVSFAVWAKPRASKSLVGGVRGGALEVAIAAPPVDGAANDAIVETVARWLSVPKSRVSIVAGRGGRQKRIAVRGIGPGAVLGRLSAERPIPIGKKRR